MRLIAVSGAHSRVGKTTLLRMMRDRLGGGTAIKLGHGPRKDKAELLFEDLEAALRFVRRKMAEPAGSSPFLFAESNRIAAELKPHLTVFIGPVDRVSKSSAGKARERADIVLDGSLSVADVRERVDQTKGFTSEERTRLGEALIEFYKDYLRRCSSDAGDLTAVILAGGRAKRLGSGDKALVMLGGRTLLDRRADLLRPLCGGIVVVSNSPDIGDRRTDGEPSFRVVRDERKELGPLMGLYSGLRCSRSEWSFITACDMPFLSPELFLHLWSLTRDCEAVVPRMGRFLEPLFAFYSRACLPAVRTCLEVGHRRADSFLELVDTRYVDEPELRRRDPRLISFFNVNTPEDLEQARLWDAAP